MQRGYCLIDLQIFRFISVKGALKDNWRKVDCLAKWLSTLPAAQVACRADTLPRHAMVRPRRCMAVTSS